MNRQYFNEAVDKNTKESTSSATTVNSLYEKNNEFLTQLINIFAERVQKYNAQGELFNPEHDKFLLSNTKILAELIKIQSNTILEKGVLEKIIIL